MSFEQIPTSENPSSEDQNAPETPETSQEESTPAGERVQKILARAGIASRRKAEELITRGEVTINGRPAQLGDRAVFGKDAIKVSGKLIHKVEAPIYLTFYKPKNVISSLADPEGRPTVGDYLKRIDERVYPVGRLDFTCEGLLLLTNDGNMAEQLQKREDIPRFYHVKVKGHPDREMISRLEKGAKLENRYVKPHSVRVLKELQNKAVVEVVILGGGAIDLKAFFETKGFLVERIARVGYGHLTLKGMSPGEFDRLQPSSVEALLAQPELAMKRLEQEKEKQEEREERRAEREARGEKLGDRRAQREQRPRFERGGEERAPVSVPRPRREASDEENQSRDQFNAEDGRRSERRPMRSARPAFGGGGGKLGGRGPRRDEGRGFGGGGKFGSRGPRRDDDRGFGGGGGFGGRGPRRDEGRGFGSRGPRRDDGNEGFTPRRSSWGGGESFAPRRGGWDRREDSAFGAGRGPRRDFGGNVALPKPLKTDLGGGASERPARTGVRRLIRAKRSQD